MNRDRVFASCSGLQKKVHVIRHNDITTDHPTMAFPRMFPFVNQHAGREFRRQSLSPIFCADCNEINRRFNPNKIEATQMFVHDKDLDVIGMMCRAKEAAADGSGYNETTSAAGPDHGHGGR
jgi:hypothetical protein